MSAEVEIPYTVTARPDTGLYSAKIGIWLFLASEAMLFGGLFSSYLFLRMGAGPGLWPHGLLNVPVGTLNTAILILSSVTVVMAWAALKMRQFSKYRRWMATTIGLAVVFLGIKLIYEYPQKFEHFGAYIKPEALAKYEPYLGNNYLASKGLSRRVEITGHLHSIHLEAGTADKPKFEAFIKKHGLKEEHGVYVIEGKEYTSKIQKELDSLKGSKAEYEVKLDAVNADPTNPVYDSPSLWPAKLSDKEAKIDKADIRWAGMFTPEHSSFFSVYFTITGLHALHIVGGVVVFLYFLGPGSALYKRNPEHLANRVECAGLYWHFVDLVWILAFPLFYLL